MFVSSSLIAQLCITMAEIDNEVPEKLSHNHPLFLNWNDNSGAILISLQLRGLKNYSVWSRAMRIAILGRNKLGFMEVPVSKEIIVQI